jgi:hypothetical protein
MQKIRKKKEVMKVNSPKLKTHKDYQVHQDTKAIMMDPEYR